MSWSGFDNAIPVSAESQAEGVSGLVMSFFEIVLEYYGDYGVEEDATVVNPVGNTTGGSHWIARGGAWGVEATGGSLFTGTERAKLPVEPVEDYDQW